MKEYNNLKFCTLKAMILEPKILVSEWYLIFRGNNCEKNVFGKVRVRICQNMKKKTFFEIIHAKKLNQKICDPNRKIVTKSETPNLSTERIVF